MSSQYKIWCLSHNPAVIAWGDDCSDRAVVIDKAAALTNGTEESQQHKGCDLVVGRYSYPLIEVICLGCRTAGYHVQPIEWQADTLRLILIGMRAEVSTVTYPIATEAGRICWNFERLNRLRLQLGIPEVLRIGATPSVEVGQP